jgi:signal transduction histidine kinase
MKAPLARGRLRRVQEAMLLLIFVGMAGYEAVEVWVLEAPRPSPTPLAILLHSLQVAIILLAAWMVRRAWRQKEVHAEALARMIEKVVFAQEDERRRIAYELHDGISPLIVSAKQHVDTCRDLWPVAPDRAEARLATSADRLGRALVEVRRVLSALQPSIVASRGLRHAARQSVDEVVAETGWAVTFHEDLGDERLPAVVETAAFRILQEAIANIRKHARADSVAIELRRDPDWLHLDVRDYGVGLPADDGRGRNGLGLHSMQERAHLVGGTCVIERAEERGTRVLVRLPLTMGA